MMSSEESEAYLEYSATLLCLTIAVVDEMRNRGWLPKEGPSLTKLGQEKIGVRGLEVAKIMSESVFRNALVTSGITDIENAKEIAELARYEGLIADLDTGFDRDLIKTLRSERTT